MAHHRKDNAQLGDTGNVQSRRLQRCQPARNHNPLRYAQADARRRRRTRARTLALARAHTHPRRQHRVCAQCEPGQPWVPQLPTTRSDMSGWTAPGLSGCSTTCWSLIVWLCPGDLAGLCAGAGLCSHVRRRGETLRRCALYSLASTGRANPTLLLRAAASPAAAAAAAAASAAGASGAVCWLLLPRSLSCTVFLGETEEHGGWGGILTVTRSLRPPRGFHLSCPCVSSVSTRQRCTRSVKQL